MVNTQQNDLITKEKIIMTQRNIDVMDIIVSKMAEGAKFSKALKLVYNKRNVCIPYNDDTCDVSIMELGLSNRPRNALIRTKIRTIGDLVEFCNNNKLTEITNLGMGSGIEIFETILDYSWEHMTQDDRVIFLIDAVERNSNNIREEIA
jgi:DNA-directed RNA polymerase alpha subunit